MPMTLFQRGEPREPSPWPYNMAHDTPMFSTILAGFATVVLFLGVTGYQSTRYHAAGVDDVDWVGAAAGHVFVVVLMLAAVTAYRWGYSRRLIAGIAVVTAMVGLSLAVLPAVTSGLGWLSCILATMFGVVLYLALGAWATVAARHLPMWWSGWARAPRPAPTQNGE